MNLESIKLEAWFVRGFYDQVKPKGLVDGTKAILGWDWIKQGLVEYAYAIATSLVREDLGGQSPPEEFYQGKYINQFKIMYKMLLVMWRLHMIPDETMFEVDPRVQPNLAKPKKKENGTTNIQ